MECLFNREIGSNEVRQRVDRSENNVQVYNRRIRATIFQRARSDFKTQMSKAKAVAKDHFRILQYLAIVILAIAHIQDLESARDLPISCRLQNLRKHPLVEQLHSWDRDTPRSKSQLGLPLTVDSWLYVFALLIGGREPDFDRQSAVLVSGGGWLVYLSSSPDTDPCYIERSVVVV